MEGLRVYLDTTVFNYYFDADRLGHDDVVRLFEAIGAGVHKGYTSHTVVEGVISESYRREGYGGVVICTAEEVLNYGNRFGDDRPIVVD